MSYRVQTMFYCAKIRGETMNEKEKERIKQVVRDMFNFYAFHMEPEEEERYFLVKDRDAIISVIEKAD